MRQTLIDAALEAGQAILPMYRAGLQADAKSDGSPVTAADRLGEEIILRHLRAAFPEIPIVAEEAASAGQVPATADRFFLVDPLDGTREFVAGRDEFTVNIGLIEAGQPVAGVVLAPALGRLFYGDTEGAFEAAANGTETGPAAPLSVRRVPRVGATVVASRSHRTPQTDEFIGRHKVDALISAGSSLKFCELAAGRADLYPRLGRTMEWDTAAADAVLRAAGGLVTTLDGLPLRYGKRRQPHDVDFANPWFVAAGDRRLLDPALLRPEIGPGIGQEPELQA